MDTVSLLVYHRVYAVWPSILLVGMVSIGLLLLVGVVLGLDALLPQLPRDPLLAPFRWEKIPARLA